VEEINTICVKCYPKEGYSHGLNPIKTYRCLSSDIFEQLHNALRCVWSRTFRMLWQSIS